LVFTQLVEAQRTGVEFVDASRLSRLHTQRIASLPTARTTDLSFAVQFIDLARF
jgi:hypothetical protein